MVLTMFVSYFRLIEEFLERLGWQKPKFKGGRSLSQHRRITSGYAKENL